MGVLGHGASSLTNMTMLHPLGCENVGPIQEHDSIYRYIHTYTYVYICISLYICVSVCACMHSDAASLNEIQFHSYGHDTCTHTRIYTYVYAFRHGVHSNPRAGISARARARMIVTQLFKIIPSHIYCIPSF